VPITFKITGQTLMPFYTLVYFSSFHKRNRSGRRLCDLDLWPGQL